MGSEVQRTKRIDGDLGIEPKSIETNRSDFLAILIENGKLQRDDIEPIPMFINASIVCPALWKSNGRTGELAMLLVVLERDLRTGDRHGSLNFILGLFLVYLHQIRQNISCELTMPRTKKAAGKARHDPLLVQLDEEELEARYGRVSQLGKRTKSKHSPILDEEPGEV